MRLREIQSVITENLPNLLNIKGKEFSRGGTNYLKITEYSSIHTSVSNLINLGLYEPERDIIDSKQLLINALSDEVSFDREGYNLFIMVINRIIHKSKALDTLITQNLHSESEEMNSLVISLPSRTLTVDEFCEINITLRDIFKLLSVIKEFQADINIENFDVGSNWIILSFISTAAVSLFGNLTSIVQRSQVGNRQLKALDKHLESIELSQEARDEVRNAQIKANLAIYQSLAQQFLESNNLDTQAEVIAQMAKVTENIDKVFSMGVGFEAAVTASNEVADTFPSLKEQKVLDQTKILEAIKVIPPKDTSDNSKENS